MENEVEKLGDKIFNIAIELVNSADKKQILSKEAFLNVTLDPGISFSISEDDFNVNLIVPVAEIALPGL